VDNVESLKALFYMLPLGSILRKYGISLHCYADNIQIVSAIEMKRC